MATELRRHFCLKKYQFMKMIDFLKRVCNNHNNVAGNVTDNDTNIHSR